MKKIVGFDANALYLWCLGQEMACGELKYIETSSIDFDNFFGFLEVNIEVPKHLYNYFSEFPPIVKNMEYSDEVCGDYTYDLVQKLWGKHTKSRKLIATFKGEKILIKSTRLKWLLSVGCVVTKLHGVIPATPRKCFSGFMNWVSDERRKGDVDLKYTIIAEACKNIGNSGFGRTVMNKNKHKNIKYCDVIKFNNYKNKWTFYDANRYEDVYEIVLSKKCIKQNMPIQIVCSVFDDSKSRMYQFYYNCIDKYIERCNF